MQSKQLTYSATLTKKQKCKTCFTREKKMSNFSGKKKSLITKEHNWFHILLYCSAVRKALLTYLSTGISSNPKSRPLFPFLSLFLSTSTTNLVNKTFLIHSYSNYRSWFKIPLKLANSKELLKKRTLRTSDIFLSFCALL